jgi:hypothetical protein
VYFSGWVLVVTTLPQDRWSDRHIMQLYQARWQIELLFKRMKQLLKLQTLRCTTMATAKATITALLLGWALLEEESTAVRQAMRDAVHCTEQQRVGREILCGSWWQEALAGPLSEWMVAEACFDLLCRTVPRQLYTWALSGVFAACTTFFVSWSSQASASLHPCLSLAWHPSDRRT